VCSMVLYLMKVPTRSLSCLRLEILHLGSHKAAFSTHVKARNFVSCFILATLPNHFDNDCHRCLLLLLETVLQMIDKHHSTAVTTGAKIIPR
jgi:hypothetical protein